MRRHSLYAPHYENYVLTPAYDLLSTALVMPEDTEELALTLCGKKRKLNRRYFVDAMLQSGLDRKVCKTIFIRFIRVADKWSSFIQKSFLPEEMQEKYIELIQNKMRIITI